MTNILTVMIATVESPAIVLLKVKMSIIKEFHDENNFNIFRLRFSCKYGDQVKLASSKPSNQDSLMPQLRNLDQ